MLICFIAQRQSLGPYRRVIKARGKATADTDTADGLVCILLRSLGNNVCCRYELMPSLSMKRVVCSSALLVALLAPLSSALGELFTQIIL